MQDAEHGLHAARQQAEVADTVEPFGQHVDQESADELVRVERHPA
jgi:hypothetical protein